MPLRETRRNAWKAWASAKAARDQGLVAHPLSLFVEATELARTEAYLDAAEFALNLNRNLERLAPIYQRHARSFGLAPHAYPIYLPGTKIGPEGWEFVLNCLLAANVTAPSRLDVQEKIAEILEERGRFGEALAWRHGVEAGRAVNSIDMRAKPAETVAEAANYARVLICNLGFPSREREPLPAIHAAVLAREQARALLDEGQAGDALPEYAASLRGYYVTDVPTQYELVGDHKLVLHEQCYYVFPRDVREFMIWDGTVYRLTGIGRHTKRRIPAWLLSLIFPYLGWFRTTLGLIRSGQQNLAGLFGGHASCVVQPPSALDDQGVTRSPHSVSELAYHLKRMILRISWRRYAVQGVLTAHRREAAMALIPMVSNVPLASDEAAPRVV